MTLDRIFVRLLAHQLLLFDYFQRLNSCISFEHVSHVLDGGGICVAVHFVVVMTYPSTCGPKLVCYDYNQSLVSLIATHSQSRLNSFQTVKTLFCIALPVHLDFISFPSCALFLAGDWPQTTIPNERTYNY